MAKVIENEMFNYRITKRINSYSKWKGAYYKDIVLFKGTGTVSEATKKADDLVAHKITYTKTGNKLTGSWLTAFGRNYITIYIKKAKQ